MTHRLVPILALALLAGGCAETNKLFQPGFADAEISWGEPVNGLRAGLARRAYEPGREPRGDSAGSRYYALTVRNVGAGPLKFVWPTDPPFGTAVLPPLAEQSVSVTVTYTPTKGEARNVTERPKNRPTVATLDPGDQRVFEFRLTPGRFRVESFADPSNLSARYANGHSKIDYGEGNGGLAEGLWVGEVRSGDVGTN